MKIKPPPIPPTGTPKDGPQKSNIPAKSNQIANSIAGLFAGSETKKKEEAQRKKGELNKAQQRKVLKKFGAKCGVSANDTPQEATQKIVHGVLEEEYDSNERGFKKMVDEISEFIQEKNPELKDKFNGWISVMQSEN